MRVGNDSRHHETSFGDRPSHHERWVVRPWVGERVCGDGAEAGTRVVVGMTENPEDRLAERFQNLELAAFILARRPSAAGWDALPAAYALL